MIRPIDKLIRLYGNRCLACGFKHMKYGQTLEMDHTLPKHSKGSNNISNLQPLCRRCNRKKYKTTYDCGERFTTLIYSAEKHILRNQLEFDEIIEEINKCSK